jgi:hypothetical protein
MFNKFDRGIQNISLFPVSRVDKKAGGAHIEFSSSSCSCRKRRRKRSSLQKDDANARRFSAAG